MFIVRFFTGSILGMISGVVLLLLLLVIAFGAATFGLAATGGPGACTPGGGPITLSDANSNAFKQKWDAFEALLDSGGSGNVAFNESEITSRANSYIEEKDIPFDDAQVCVHDGYGEGTAKLSFIGLTVKFKLKGTMDLSGDHPKADIDDIEIGNVPGFMTAPVESVINNALDDALNDVDIDHTYTLDLTEGQAAVTGTQ